MHELIKILDEVVPTKRIRNCSTPLLETSEVCTARVDRNQADGSYLADKNMQNKKLRNLAVKTLKQVTHLAVQNFESKLAQNTDVKPFWHYVNSSRKSKPSIDLVENNGKLASCDKECAQVLSQFYASVYTVENDATIPFAVPKTTEELMSITFSPYMIAIWL